MSYDRRTVLLTASLAAAAVGLGSCRSGPDGPDPDAAPATVSLDEIPVGGALILPDAPYVVSQPTAGEVKAFTNLCTHQHCPVSRIDGADIVCDCHGSRFSIDDGSVVNGPASEPLTTYPASLDGDTVTVN